MPNAARLGDAHVCPIHGGGAIALGSPDVLIEGLAAARVSDVCICPGPPNMVAAGSATVLINGLPAARVGDLTAHAGVVASGAATVIIGGEATTPPPDNAGDLLATEVTPEVTPDEDGTAPLAPSPTLV